jgi:hypothetical protein
MKKRIYIVGFLIPLVIAFACEDKPEVYEFPIDKYIYEIPDVPVVEDYVIGVAYDLKYRDTLENVWWDATNKKHQLYTGTPRLGEYDLRKEPETLLQHLKWGKEAGIDFFVFSWGGHGYNDTILNNWERYYQQDTEYPKVVIRFDPGYRFKSGKDTLQLMPVLMDSLRFEFDSLYTHVMMHDFAYKKDGVPAMTLCNFTNSGQIPRVRDFTAFLKNTANNHLWIMADLGGGWTSPERWGYHAKNGYANGVTDGYIRPDSIAAFDAFYITDTSHENYDRYYSEYSYLDYNYKYWQERMLPLGKEYIPTIMPGYDDRVNTPGSGKYLIPRWDGEKAYAISSFLPDGVQYNWSNVTENPYKKWANVAKRNVGPSRIIMIFNWNDFQNGRNLEPTVEFETDYLKYTREFFKRP